MTEINLQYLPVEMLCMISDHIDSGRDWKSWIFTCSRFAEMNSEEQILKQSNPLWSLILKNPTAKWNWHQISINPCTTYDIVDRYPDFPFDWHSLSFRLEFPKRFYDELSHLLDTYYDSSKHDDFDVDDIELDEFDKELYSKHINVLRYICALSKNDFIECSFIKKHPYLPWNWFELSTTVDIKFIITNDFPWDKIGTSLNPSVTPEIIQETSAYDLWSWYMEPYGENQSLTFEFFSSMPHVWDIEALSINKSIDVRFINLYPDELWNWESLSDVPKAMEIFDSYPDKSWDFDTLSRHKSIPLNILKKHPNKPWNMWHVSINVEISCIQDIYNNLNIKWNYIALLGNPRVDFDEYIKNFELMENHLIVYKPGLSKYTIDTIRSMDKGTAEIIESTEYIDNKRVLSYLEIPHKTIDKYKKWFSYKYTIAVNPKSNWMRGVEMVIDESIDFEELSDNWFGREDRRLSLSEYHEDPELEKKFNNLLIEAEWKAELNDLIGRLAARQNELKNNETDRHHDIWDFNPDDAEWPENDIDDV